MINTDTMTSQTMTIASQIMTIIPNHIMNTTNQIMIIMENHITINMDIMDTISLIIHLNSHLNSHLNNHLNTPLFILLIMTISRNQLINRTTRDIR
ncbi:hypothetical protein CBL_01554 [Carabus blaptoides fortunei]